MEAFEGQVGGLGASWRHLGGSWRLLEGLGAILEALGAILEDLEGILEPLDGPRWRYETATCAPRQQLKSDGGGSGAECAGPGGDLGGGLRSPSQRSARFKMHVDILLFNIWRFRQNLETQIWHAGLSPTGRVADRFAHSAGPGF